jgi:hypothetical protein
MPRPLKHPELIRFRVSAEQRAVMERACEASGAEDMSSWLRVVLEAATREKPDGAGGDDVDHGGDGAVHPAAVDLAGDQDPRPRAVSATILVFGPIGEDQAFASALFEVTIDAAQELLRRAGPEVLLATSQRDEVMRLRADNERLSSVLQAIGGAVAGIGGHNGHMAPVADRGGVRAGGRPDRARRRHGVGGAVAAPEAEPGAQPAAEGEEGGPSELYDPEDERGNDDTDPFTFDGLIAELAAVGPERSELVDNPEDIPPERTWEPRINMFKQQGFWLPDWGAQPGRSGCEVPDFILEAHGYPPA